MSCAFEFYLSDYSIIAMIDMERYSKLPVHWEPKGNKWTQRNAKGAYRDRSQQDASIIIALGYRI